MIKLIFKYLFLGTVGGVTYLIIEMLYRGYTFTASFIMGFLAFLFCGLLNEVLPWDTPLVLQMLYGGAFITFIEFVVGCIVNILLKLNQWDYSNLPFNLLGQTCLLFSFFWFLLSGIAIIMDDYLRYWFFDEENPRYKIF